MLHSGVHSQKITMGFATKAFWGNARSSSCSTVLQSTEGKLRRGAGMHADFCGVGLEREQADSERQKQW